MLLPTNQVAMLLFVLFVGFVSWQIGLELANGVDWNAVVDQFAIVADAH